jgi:hypothetical protein
VEEDNMQVLLQRVQKGKVFSLWMKYELAKDEEELIDRYDIRKVILVEGNPREEWSRARRMAGALAIIVYIAGVFWAASQRANDFQALLGAIPLAVLVFAVAVFVIRYKIRETINVRDILNGRHFACRSIITLLNKEEELGNLAQKFAVFLDTLKDWGGRAVVEIPPGRPPIARLIGKPRAAAE